MNFRKIPFFEFDSVATRQDFLSALTKTSKRISRLLKIKDPQAYAVKIGERHHQGYVRPGWICYVSPQTKVKVGDLVIALNPSGTIEVIEEIFEKQLLSFNLPPEKAQELLAKRKQTILHKIVAIHTDEIT